MKNVVKCASCGKLTRNTKYCSQHCRTHKVTKEELLDMLNRYTLTATADILEISIPLVYKLMNSYSIKKTGRRYSA